MCDINLDDEIGKKTEVLQSPRYIRREEVIVWIPMFIEATFLEVIHSGSR
jgi:hypothetical protein